MIIDLQLFPEPSTCLACFHPICRQQLVIRPSQCAVFIVFCELKNSLTTKKDPYCYILNMTFQKYDLVGSADEVNISGAGVGAGW